MDNDDDPEPSKNDDEPCDEASDNESTVTKTVNKTSKSTVTVHLEPHQPKRSKFLIVVTGGQCRSFLGSWYSKWPWLEWDDGKECAFRHPCRMATILNIITFSKKAEMTFSTGGI